MLHFDLSRFFSPVELIILNSRIDKMEWNLRMKIREIDALSCKIDSTDMAQVTWLQFRQHYDKSNTNAFSFQIHRNNRIKNNSSFEHLYDCNDFPVFYNRRSAFLWLRFDSTTLD